MLAEGIAVLRNSAPVWNEGMAAFTLPFYARAQLPSLSNVCIKLRQVCNHPRILLPRVPGSSNGSRGRGADIVHRAGSSPLRVVAAADRPWGTEPSAS